MIDFSICPDAPIRSGQDIRGRSIVTGWLNSLTSVPANQDSSAGALKAAVTSNNKLYVTSYQYVLGSGAFTCMNVMVSRKDYRLIIGYDNQVTRVETIDPRAARAETRKQAQRWAPSNTPDTLNLADDDDPADNYNTTEPDNYNTTNSPYGVRIPASPYGVRIPAQSSRLAIGGHRN